MLPERMRARRAPSSGEARGTTIVATHGPIVAGPNAGTRITTRHVNPTPSAAFALNSAKASTVLLCCCGARVGKGYNREKADGRQITHYIFALLLTASTQYNFPWSFSSAQYSIDWVKLPIRPPISLALVILADPITHAVASQHPKRQIEIAFRSRFNANIYPAPKPMISRSTARQRGFALLSFKTKNQPHAVTTTHRTYCSASLYHIPPPRKSLV